MAFHLRIYYTIAHTDYSIKIVELCLVIFYCLMQYVQNLHILHSYSIHLNQKCFFYNLFLFHFRVLSNFSETKVTKNKRLYQRFWNNFFFKDITAN